MALEDGEAVTGTGVMLAAAIPKIATALRLNTIMALPSIELLIAQAGLNNLRREREDVNLMGA